MAALDVCSDELGVDAAELHVVGAPAGEQHYKSRIFYVARRDAATPECVVKVDSSPAYDPRHEFDALELADEILRAAGSGRSLGVVRPVGFGSEPGFLVTRFQVGELAHVAIDAAVTGWRRPRPVERAEANARAIARWLAVFRAAATRDEGGLTPEAYLEEINARALRLRALVGDRPELAALPSRVESQLLQLDTQDLARLSQSRPNRGDARPKNFISGADGVLYALDMEGFGYGPLEHDLACVHHALEYDGVRTRAAARRASAIWAIVWDEYMQHGNSPAIALLGYQHFLLSRMLTSAPLMLARGPRGRLRWAIWTRDRMRWLGGLRGDLAADARHLRSRV